MSAPYSVSQRLMNPAAAVSRPYQATAINFENSQESTKVLDLVNSEISENIQINQLVGHLSMLVKQKWFLEIDIAYQSGTKDTKNEFSDQGNVQVKNNQNKMNLIPLQAQIGTSLSSNWNIGAKTLATLAQVDTTDRYSTFFQGQKNDVTSNNKLDAKIIILGVGTIYNFNKFFSFSYAADFNQFRFNTEIKADSTFSPNGNSQMTTNTDIKSSTVTTIRRDILGIGFSSGNTKGNAFRAELSVERLTPLSNKSDLKDGVQVRATAETQWSYFHIGAEYITRQGYLIDSYNLIPYFFKFEEFSNQTKVDYGVFGGLKSSKGHSVGGSFTISTEKVQQQLSVSDSNIYSMEKKSQNIGLNYSYTF